MSLTALALVLDGAFADAPPIGEATDPADERVRFRAHPGLGFPDGEVRALVQPESGPLVVFQSLLGLHGPSSPLPPYITERVIADDGAEGTLARFLDFFNHRLVALMLRGFRHRRPNRTVLRGGGRGRAAGTGASLGPRASRPRPAVGSRARGDRHRGHRTSRPG